LLLNDTSVRVIREKQTMLVHALAATIISGCALAALLGLPFWICVAGGLCLTLTSVWCHEKLRPRFLAVGSTQMLMTANLASLADSCLVTAAAWCVGAVFRWLLVALS
jgi:hypothetical protein